MLPSGHDREPPLTGHSRLKDLESQVDQLRRARTLENVVQSSAGGHDSIRQSPIALPIIQGSASSVTSRQSSSASPAALQPSPTVWLRVDGPEGLSSPYILESVVLSAEQVYTLFRHFEALYSPHFCILEPVTSIAGLAKDSPLLFWTIVATAVRNHARFHHHYENLRQAYHRLYGQTCCSAVQSFRDLQAILLLCAWPGVVIGQQNDPSWMQLGMAINAARNIGLDKAANEVLFGLRRTWHSITVYPEAIRKMAWLKAFELDVQLSLWHGHSTSLSYSTDTLRNFCSDPEITRTYAAIIEVHIETALYIEVFHQGVSKEASSSLIRRFDSNLDAVKRRNTEAWTVDAEIALLGGKLYLFASRLTGLEKHQRQTDDPSQSIQVPSLDTSQLEALHAARSTAVDLANLFLDVSSELHAGQTASEHLEDSHSLPGRKHVPSSYIYTRMICPLTIHLTRSQSTPTPRLFHRHSATEVPGQCSQ
jgi:hypothetical protein